MRSAAGDAGSPGMVRISPVRTTTNPAPALTRRPLTVTVKSSGVPPFAGSSEKLYCVFAMQTGRQPYPRAPSFSS